VLTLDSPKETNQIITAVAKKTFRERKSRTLTTTAQKNAQAEYKTTMERMSSVAERLRSLQLDDEESQRLQLLRRAEARRKRRSGGTSASAPPACVVRIPSSAEDQVAQSRSHGPKGLEVDCDPQPPLKRQDTVPPPPPPDEVMQEALAPYTAPVAPMESPSCAENFAPPAHPPSPQVGKRPVLHGNLERALSQKSQESFQGSAFAELDLKIGPEAVKAVKLAAG